MRKRFIQSFECRFIEPGDEDKSLAELSASLPRRAARRMSTLGILLHSVLGEEPIDLETTLVYGTTFTEANALENFLDSLPYASPRGFQTSIHPGGIEQALILRKQAIGTFLPLAGEEGLMLQLLKSTFTTTGARTLVCGGEEKGSWLREFGVAYPLSFAFSLLVSENPSGSIGSIEWRPSGDEFDVPELNMEETVRQMKAKQPLTLGSRDHGVFKIFFA